MNKILMCILGLLLFALVIYITPAMYLAIGNAAVTGWCVGKLIGKVSDKYGK